MKEFQFPTNGKVYPKLFKEAIRWDCLLCLFQFPTNGKVYPKKGRLFYKKKGIKCFNSLRTGRCIQSNISQEVLEQMLCFNSLRTGRCIQSRPCWRRNEELSRRFNSLRTGRCIQRHGGTIFMFSKRRKFQFPTNGKVYPKYTFGKLNSERLIVSIPYEREGVSKGQWVL